MQHRVITLRASLIRSFRRMLRRDLLPSVLRVGLSTSLVLLAWQGLVELGGVPRFVFPSPIDVTHSLYHQGALLFEHSLTTAAEIILGLTIGCALGIVSAVALTLSAKVRRWTLPLMIISQALPVFALAPLLTLWFGYGMTSKVVMAVLIIYFPVVASTFDGLRQTPSAMIDLAKTLNGRPLSVLWHIRLPSAFPAMASGIRVATSVAPIGAVVGEWVGSSRGLGYLMLQANGRMQTDLMFAALLCLCVLALTLYSIIHALLDYALYWQKDTTHNQYTSP